MIASLKRICLALISILSIFAIFIYWQMYPRGHQRSPHIHCASNLKQIGLALKMYSLDNNDHFPSGNAVECLSVLRKGSYLKDAESLVCPGTKDRPAKPDVPLTQENISYVYLGSGLTEADSPDSPLAADKMGCKHQGRNILYLNGQVRAE
jgi:hypothetical protein